MHGAVWNLFLAVIPAVLAAVLAWGLRFRCKRRWFPLWLLIPLTLAWLAFLPNSCYLLTEWRHFLFEQPRPLVADVADVSGADMLHTAKWAVYFALYSGIGVLLFALAIRPIEQHLISRKHKPWLYAPFFFFAISFGVYLGLQVRLNSWEFVTHPAEVVDQITAAIQNSHLLRVIAFFAAALWIIYEGVDIWIDGVMMRLKRWGVWK